MKRSRHANASVPIEHRRLTAGHMVPWTSPNWWMRFVRDSFGGGSLAGAGLESLALSGNHRQLFARPCPIKRGVSRSSRTLVEDAMARVGARRAASMQTATSCGTNAVCLAEFQEVYRAAHCFCRSWQDGPPRLLFIWLKRVIQRRNCSPPSTPARRSSQVLQLQASS